MKDCLIIGNNNCITYKNVFPLFKDRILHQSSAVHRYDNTDKTFGNHFWFTTLIPPNKKKLILTKTYNEKDYPKYDNYEAINVDKIKDIPYNYDGLMGCPITILQYDLYNVEVVDEYIHPAPEIRGGAKFARVVIKLRDNGQKECT